MNTAPELLEEKEVAVILAILSLLGHVANPTQVQEAYQKALGQVKKAPGMSRLAVICWLDRTGNKEQTMRFEVTSGDQILRITDGLQTPADRHGDTFGTEQELKELTGAWPMKRLSTGFQASCSVIPSFTRHCQTNSRRFAS